MQGLTWWIGVGLVVILIALIVFKIIRKTR